MTRRHSSGTSDTPIVRDTSPQVNTNGTAMKPLVPYGSFPLVADERRWSIAAAECRRPSVLFVSVTLHCVLECALDLAIDLVLLFGYNYLRFLANLWDKTTVESQFWGRTQDFGLFILECFHCILLYCNKLRSFVMR